MIVVYLGGVRKASMNSKSGNAENQFFEENKKVEISQTGAKTPKDKLQGEIAKVIQKAEERKQKRLNRQKEVCYIFTDINPLNASVALI